MNKVFSEKYLDDKLKAKIKGFGGLYIKLTPFSLCGLPDRLCLLPGARVIFAEIKTTGEDPSKLQLIVHRKLRKLGFTVLVIDTLKQINDL
jgi:hypothetical protein